MNVIGYTYEASTHCVDCTKERFGNDVPDDAQDIEGNFIHPLFSTDEIYEGEFCDDCLKPI